MYHRGEEDYGPEDYDEYEEEASEEEEEEEEKVKEEPVSKDQQDFLKLRERLKEKFRRDLKEQTASAFGRQSLLHDKRRTTTTNDKFGSFFGPSQPVIASRVIDESRSIRETQHTRAPTSSSSSRPVKDGASKSSQSKAHVPQHKPKPVNEVKKKAQTLKDMRDYSFLLSDDADFPSTKEEPKQQRARANSDVQSARPSLKSRPPVPARPATNGQASKSSASKSMQLQGRAMPSSKGAVLSKPRPAGAAAEVNRKHPGSNGMNGSGSRPLAPKAAPSRVPVQASSMNQSRAKDGHPSLKNRPPVGPISSSAGQRNHNEQKRPIRAPDRVKTAARPPLPSSRPPSSSLKVAKQPLPSSKPSTSKPQPKQIPQRDIRDDRRKKQPMKRRLDDDDDEDAIGMIRQMFGYNPNRYAGMDEDDSDMEADFSTIQKEERRSSKIAQKEDEEQLRLIEEEERRERMRKKQKLSRH